MKDKRKSGIGGCNTIRSEHEPFTPIVYGTILSLASGHHVMSPRTNKWKLLYHGVNMVGNALAQYTGVVAILNNYPVEKTFFYATTEVVPP